MSNQLEDFETLSSLTDKVEMLETRITNLERDLVESELNTQYLSGRVQWAVARIRKLSIDKDKAIDEAKRWAKIVKGRAEQ